VKRRRPRTIDLASLSLRQYLVLEAAPPIYSGAELLARLKAAGLVTDDALQPRLSEMLRGDVTYPAAREPVRRLLGVEDAFLRRLIENGAPLSATPRPRDQDAGPEARRTKDGNRDQASARASRAKPGEPGGATS
jgi:hypothetical protein